jgi:hypothetical protein
MTAAQDPTYTKVVFTCADSRLDNYYEHKFKDLFEQDLADVGGQNPPPGLMLKWREQMEAEARYQEHWAPDRGIDSDGNQKVMIPDVYLTW